MVFHRNPFHPPMVVFHFHLTGRSDILGVAHVARITTILGRTNRHGLFPETPTNIFQPKTANLSDRRPRSLVLQVEAISMQHPNWLLPLVLVNLMQDCSTHL